VRVPPADLFATLQTLRQDPELQLDLLANLAGVDYPPERIRIHYHLVSLSLKHRLCVQVDLPRADPEVASVVPIWNAANFFEREVYDLFGVRFLGHPNLKRILMDDDFVGWPLRKDFTHPQLVHKPER